ncbi:DOMON domain-containing protein frrs1L [Mactra antiquata]
MHITKFKCIWSIFVLIQVVSAINWDTGCGTTKGCFPNCPNGCSYLVTWTPGASTIAFTMSAEESASNQYLAIGFSSDIRMGDDSVVACATADNSIKSYFNDDTDSDPLSPNTLGLSSTSVSQTNGVISCSFTRSVNEADSQFFDLNNPYILMLVIGETETEDGTTKIEKHYMIPWMSDGDVDFKSTNIYDEYKLNSPRVKLHGIMMTIAWLFLCTVGIVTARYNKGMLPEKKLFGTKIWFQVHRGGMVLALVFVIIGFISIFVENKGYSQITPSKSSEAVQAHPVLGIIVTVLCFVNPIMALLRPGPDHKLRWLFNWAHLGVGVVALVLAVVTTFLGYFLERSKLPLGITYVTVVYIILAIVIVVLLEVHRWKANKTVADSSPDKEFKEFDASKSMDPTRVAFIGLIVFTIVAFGFLLGMIGIIGAS